MSASSVPAVLAAASENASWSLFASPRDFGPKPDVKASLSKSEIFAWIASWVSMSGLIRLVGFRLLGERFESINVLRKLSGDRR